MEKQNLNDPMHRNINYLRVSITDKCNLQCIYCRPHGEIPKLNHDDILRYEEIYRIIGIAADLGISKIRITGGEPLVRKGVIPFLHRLKTLEKIKDISLTTNGVYLPENLHDLQTTAIKRLNISLDSLKADKFERITGFDRFDHVWDGILQAHDLGFRPIKINVVAMRGINDDELVDFAELTFKYPFHIRFIEHMPMGNPALAWKKPMQAAEIKERISAIGPLTPVRRSLYDGPADRNRIPGAVGEIGFISPISRHFCHTCNRLRLTADGRLRPCLLSDYSEDLKTPLREGCTDARISEIIFRTVKNKPSRHLLSETSETPLKMVMSSIGG